MKVCMHLAVRVTIYAKPIEHIGESGEELLTIFITEEDLLFGVSARHHVIQGTGYVNAKGSGHGRLPRKRCAKRRTGS